MAKKQYAKENSDNEFENQNIEMITKIMITLNNFEKLTNQCLMDLD